MYARVVGISMRARIRVSKEAAALLRATVLKTCGVCETPLAPSDLKLTIRYAGKLICRSCQKAIVRLYMIKKKQLERRFRK